MSDRLDGRGPPRSRRRSDPLTAAARLFSDEQRSMSKSREIFNSSDTQEELWAYYDSNGEYAWSVDWLAKGMSRVRLTAAEMVRGGDEPQVLTDGPAAEAVARLGEGFGGHGAILSAATVHLSVPGEGWLVGEKKPGSVELWRIYSKAEIRPSSGTYSKYDVLEEENAWRPLARESFVTRVWVPDPQRHFLARSPAKPALPILRRIDLIDRRIVATLVSRLAMNGMLLIPSEGTFDVPARYGDAADPFMAYWIDIASHNIKNPGSASAALPMPVKFSREYIKDWYHLTFGSEDGFPSGLLDERDKELRRLANTVNVPAEVVLGMADANHWTAWQLEESAIKLHISPLAEIECDAFTTGFLYPFLSGAGKPLTGPNGGRVIVWYDTSELTARPDKTDPAFRAYDRFELSGEALRRETGFDEGDRPDDAELRDQVLKRLAATVQQGLYALSQLTEGGAAQTPLSDGPDGGPGGDVDPDVAPASGPSDSGERDGEQSPAQQRQPPDTQGTPPPPPGSDAAAAYPAVLPAFIAPDLEQRAPVGAGNGHAAGGKSAADSGGSR